MCGCVCVCVRLYVCLLPVYCTVMLMHVNCCYLYWAWGVYQLKHMFLYIFFCNSPNFELLFMNTYICTEKIIILHLL